MNGHVQLWDVDSIIRCNASGSGVVALTNGSYPAGAMTHELDAPVYSLATLRNEEDKSATRMMVSGSWDETVRLCSLEDVH